MAASCHGPASFRSPNAVLGLRQETSAPHPVATFATMAPFAWIIPDVYPVITALGLAVGLTMYSGSHCLYNNPEVFINKKQRNDPVAENAEWFKRKSDMYGQSAFRSIGKAYGKPQIFPNDYFTAPAK